MSLNREMLQIARLSPRVLGDAAPLVAQFLHGLAQSDGGYADRAGTSDLYYTTFAVSGLVALQEAVPWDAVLGFLASFDDDAELDLVHQSCLARVWSLSPAAIRPRLDVDRILTGVETLRTPDGGYHTAPDAEHGTLYGCFLALGIYQDLGGGLPKPDRLRTCIAALKAPDGGYANGRDLPLGLTPSSAAAAALLRQLNAPPDDDLAPWILSRLHPSGGFLAAPDAPLPDLLSTATALHALASLRVDLAPLKEPCLDFIDTLWTARGGFHGTWEDDDLDCEYTYYGLLALGHLSL